MSAFVDYFSRGVLGTVALADSRDTVLAALGQPEDVSVSKKPEIWKYGSLQLSFANTKRGMPAPVDFIGVYFSETPFRLPEKAEPDDWLPDNGTTPEQLSRYLAPYGLALERAEALSFGTQLGFRVAKYGCVVFELIDGKAMLASAQVMMR
jgi:hypothetical protein